MANTYHTSWWWVQELWDLKLDSPVYKILIRTSWTFGGATSTSSSFRGSPGPQQTAALQAMIFPTVSAMVVTRKWRLAPRFTRSPRIPPARDHRKPMHGPVLGEIIGQGFFYIVTHKHKFSRLQHTRLLLSCVLSMFHFSNLFTSFWLRSITLGLGTLHKHD